MTGDEAIERAATVVRVLGDRTRLRTVLALVAGEPCVGDLEDRLGVPQPLVSFHLAKLRAVGLVRTRRASRRDARRVYYAVDPDGWARAVAALRAGLPPVP
jgi:DNA-binding transcriptional ArsR family regulator